MTNLKEYPIFLARTTGLVAHCQGLLHLYFQYDYPAGAGVGRQHILHRVLHYDGIFGALLFDYLQ